MIKWFVDGKTKIVTKVKTTREKPANKKRPTPSFYDNPNIYINLDKYFHRPLSVKQA